jgi:hypothetical protein
MQGVLSIIALLVALPSAVQSIVLLCERLTRKKRE